MNYKAVKTFELKTSAVDKSPSPTMQRAGVETTDVLKNLGSTVFVGSGTMILKTGAMPLLEMGTSIFFEGGEEITIK